MGSDNTRYCGTSSGDEYVDDTSSHKSSPQRDLQIPASQEPEGSASESESAEGLSPHNVLSVKRARTENDEPRAAKRSRNMATPAIEDRFTAALQTASEQYRQSEGQKQALQRRISELEGTVETMTHILNESRREHEELQTKYGELEAQLKDERENSRRDSEEAATKVAQVKDRIKSLSKDKTALKHRVRMKMEAIQALGDRNRALAKELEEEKLARQATTKAMEAMEEEMMPAKKMLEEQKMPFMERIQSWKTHWPYACERA